MWTKADSNRSIGDFIRVVDERVEEKPWTYLVAFDYKFLNE
jgi:hypothetical protein